MVATVAILFSVTLAFNLSQIVFGPIQSKLKASSIVGGLRNTQEQKSHPKSGRQNERNEHTSNASCT